MVSVDIPVNIPAVNIAAVNIPTVNSPGVNIPAEIIPALDIPTDGVCKYFQTWISFSAPPRQA